MTRRLLAMTAICALAALTINGLLALATAPAPDPFEYKDELHDLA